MLDYVSRNTYVHEILFEQLESKSHTDVRIQH